MADEKPITVDDSPTPPAAPAAPKPPAAPAYTGPDPYTLFQQGADDMKKAEARIEQLSAERRQLAFTPLPRTAPPALQDIPKPPQEQMRSVFQAAAPALMFLTAMAAGRFQGDGMNAMRAATGFIEGFQAGDK